MTNIHKAKREAQCLGIGPKSVHTRESPGNTRTLSVLCGPAGEFSEGPLCGWPNLLVGLQEPTLIVPYRGVTERNLRRSGQKRLQAIERKHCCCLAEN